MFAEGGNRMINYLLSKAIKQEIPEHYKDVLKIKEKDPKAYQEWVKAMKTEIQALKD